MRGKARPAPFLPEKKEVTEAITIKGLDENGNRISSKDFEELVQEAFKKSNHLILETYGQHNVGGRLNPKGGRLEIRIKGPAGQRLGCMGMPGATITCHGSASISAPTSS